MRKINIKTSLIWLMIVCVVGLGNVLGQFPLNEINPNDAKDFINEHSFDNPAYREQIFGKDEPSSSRTVRVIYLIPQDKVYKESYRIAVGNAIVHLQKFYQDEIGGNNAFTLNQPVVEVYQTTHTSAFYEQSTGDNLSFWSRVLADGFALTQSGFNHPNHRLIFFVDATNNCSQVIGGLSGVALLNSYDLRGISRDNPATSVCGSNLPQQQVCLRIGGLGHELGHAFGLPHPPGCDQGTCGDYEKFSLMYLGYAYYQNTYFIQNDRNFLLFNTGYFMPFNIEGPRFHCDTNAIDDHRIFVRANYLDFLGREPDQAGWDYWTNEIVQVCGGNQTCIENRRIDVSAAYFFSAEFQDKGGFLYNTYKTGLGRTLLHNEYQNDLPALTPINGENPAQAKERYANSFALRTDFLTRFPQTGAAAFVDAYLNDILAITGANLFPRRDEFISAFQSSSNGKGKVLFLASSSIEVQNAERNRLFVLMEYFGYLRRDPDQAGYDYWLNLINQNPNNSRGMVCAFITSAEYQLRFGYEFTRTNQVCQNLGL